MSLPVLLIPKICKGNRLSLTFCKSHHTTGVFVYYLCIMCLIQVGEMQASTEYVHMCWCVSVRIPGCLWPAAGSCCFHPNSGHQAELETMTCRTAALTSAMPAPPLPVGPVPQIHSSQSGWSWNLTTGCEMMKPKASSNCPPYIQALEILALLTLACSIPW